METVSDDDMYTRGLRLVSDLILPKLAHNTVTGDIYSEVDGLSDYCATAVLYSPRKDITANIYLLLKLDNPIEDAVAEKGLAAVFEGGNLGAASMGVTVTFLKGRFEPTDAYYYGDPGFYFTRPDDYETSAGKLILKADTAANTSITAYLGSRAGDELNIGTIDTMAVWLRDAEELHAPNQLDI